MLAFRPGDMGDSTVPAVADLEEKLDKAIPSQVLGKTGVGWARNWNWIIATRLRSMLRDRVPRSNINRTFFG
jgi:hypothetical protein